MIHNFCSSIIENQVLNEVNHNIDAIEKRKEEEEKRRLERIEQLKKDMARMKLIQFFKFTSLNKKRVKKSPRKYLKKKKSCSDNEFPTKKSSDLLHSILVNRRKRRNQKLKCRFCSSRYYK